VVGTGRITTGAVVVVVVVVVGAVQVPPCCQPGARFAWASLAVSLSASTLEMASICLSAAWPFAWARMFLFVRPVSCDPSQALTYVGAAHMNIEAAVKIAKILFLITLPSFFVKE